MTGNREGHEVATHRTARNAGETDPWRCNACDDRFPSWESFKQHLRESEECQLAVIQA